MSSTINEQNFALCGLGKLQGGLPRDAALPEARLGFYTRTFFHLLALLGWRGGRWADKLTRNRANPRARYSRYKRHGSHESCSITWLPMLHHEIDR